MASYHCTVKVGGKGKAGAHAAYISREGKYSGSERYEDLEATAYGNMPEWSAHNPAHLWTAADEYERVNGATYREIEVALPRELTPEQRRALVEDFIGQEIGDKHAYQWAIHTPDAALEKGEQPHAHIMYSERTIDGIDRDPEQYFKRYNSKTPEKGGCRKDSAGTEERLQATRQRWADVQNRHLERHGQHGRVDHRSLKAQGIARQAEMHIGASRVMGMAEQDVGALLARRAAEGALERAQHEVSSLIDLSGDLSAAMAQRQARHALDLAIQQEAEHERIRSTAFERIGANFTAASADSGRATEHIKAAQRHRLTAREYLGTAIGLANAAERDPGRVAKAAHEHRHGRHVESIAQTLGAELGRVIPEVARATARLEAIAKAHQVELQRQALQRQAQADATRQAALPAGSNPLSRFHPDNIAKIAALAKDAKEQERLRQSVVAELEKKVHAAGLTPAQHAIAMARVRENVETTLASLMQFAPKAEAPAARPKANQLSVDDRALFQRAEQAIVAGDMKTLSGQLHKIDQVERKLIDAVTLAGRDATPFDEDGASRQLSVRDAHRRREAINAAAMARGEKYIPFAAGYSTLTSDTYDYQQEQAVRALSQHARSGRPEGFFNRKAGREWDARKVELEMTRAAWAGAVASRARAEQEATTADNATFQYRLDAIRKEHATKAAAALAKCAPIKERLQDFTVERKRIERVTATLSQEKQKELGRERGRGHGISR